MFDLDDGYHGVKVLVFGASGFIGRWVARALCAQKADVQLVVHNEAIAREIFPGYGVGGDIFELDIRNSELVERLIDRIKPSVTFNLAGYGIDRTERDEETAYQINAHFVKALCEGIARGRDSRWSGQDLIHVGSALEYGSSGGSLREDSTPHPNTLYGKSKLAGTQVLTRSCRALKTKGIAARLFTVYGPGEHEGRLLPSLLETARTGRLLQLTNGDQKRDFTYVADVAEGLLRLGLSSAMPGEVVNLATGHLTSVRSFAESAAMELRIPSTRLGFGAIPTRAEEMDHSDVSLERLRQLVGWTPSVPIAEGIRRTVEFESSFLALS